MGILRWIFSFKASKPPGVDGVPGSDLCRNLEVIRGVMLFIYKGNIFTREIPLDLITGIVRLL